MEVDKTRWYSDILKVIDSMEGHQFEHFCAKLLELNGYRDVEVTRGSGDFGLDIKARYHNLIYGIQCKRWSNNVGPDGVKDAISGSEYHGCDVAVVLTNNHFTKNAVKWAKRTGVRLWDRNDLCNFIDQCENLDFIWEYINQSNLNIVNNTSKTMRVNKKDADNILKEKGVIQQVPDKKQKSVHKNATPKETEPKKAGGCICFLAFLLLFTWCCYKFI